MSIFNACGNERLSRTLSGLYDEMDRLLHLGLFSERDTSVMKVNHEEQGHQHDAIIDALAAQDSDRAAEATMKHIEDSRTLALKAIVNGRLSFSL
jgi:DNA-binding GntR family transcriptional regulator